MTANGERDAGKGGDRKSQSRGATVKLYELGIPKDRASRAMQLAAVTDAPTAHSVAIEITYIAFPPVAAASFRAFVTIPPCTA